MLSGLLKWTALLIEGMDVGIIVLICQKCHNFSQDVTCWKGLGCSFRFAKCHCPCPISILVFFFVFVMYLSLSLSLSLSSQHDDHLTQSQRSQLSVKLIKWRGRLQSCARTTGKNLILSAVWILRLANMTPISDMAWCDDQHSSLDIVHEEGGEEGRDLVESEREP